MGLLNLSQGVSINTSLVGLARTTSTGGNVHFFDGTQHAIQGREDAAKVEAALEDYAGYAVTEYGESVRFLINPQVVTRLQDDSAARVLKLQIYGVTNALVVPGTFAEKVRGQISAAIGA
ncbi:MAG: hypothetical protein ACAI35_26160 [Candidatus Methylacidiphilales bacterium]|nr:hypothetical protein [Candidatus Methylacidiphilales bacterium]